ncbi:MAG TPA: glycosyltransferase [Terracidiphilus sp.]|nr:glycosyltransferase [Terracidiphilus sp.]
MLYGIAPEESASVRTFLEALECLPAGFGQVELIVWDNSPHAQHGAIPRGVEYIHDSRNLGLANAYNRAVEAAIQRGSEWLITLDQDTEVPSSFLVQMARAAREAAQFAGVAAVVPLVFSGTQILSPNRFVLGAIPRWYRAGDSRSPQDRLFAFNSGAMISVRTLEQVGGYSPWFWLDNSDSKLFRSLHEHGKRVFVAEQIALQHNFSLKDMETRMSPQRYRHTLLSESAFWDWNMNWLAGCERTARLGLRTARQWVRGESRELRMISWKGFKRRLATTRHERLREWRHSTAKQMGSGLDECALRPRPKRVSVCMAAYNGSKFIEQQLRSVLDQLSVHDEVVIVDDGSQDDTVRLIEQMKDPRIRLLLHRSNRGVVATFEDALRCASGEFLFLCDDDDIWPAGKVERFLKAFGENPDAAVVISGVRVIDENGATLTDSPFIRRFVPGFWKNLIKNHYQGSAMAMRASLLGRILPFPKSRWFVHDAWIGTRAELLGTQVVFIDEDLLLYRRHSQNVTRKHSVLRAIQARIELLAAHANYLLHQATR